MPILLSLVFAVQTVISPLPNAEDENLERPAGCCTVHQEESLPHSLPRAGFHCTTRCREREVCEQQR
ncbi:MAG: hypothetical protein KDK40_00340 [Chlamydiia bacterium]|nr:hypothetical protein [Chlamydiia bacterium]